MEVTRRGWQTAAIAGVLAGVGLVAAQPLYLAGAGAVATYALGRHLQTVLAIQALVADLEVAESPARTRATVDTPIHSTLEATLDSPSILRITVNAETPATVTRSGEASLSLAPGETSASTSSDLTVPVAGEHTIPAPTVTVHGPGDLVTHSFTMGDPTSIAIDPRYPRELHVGQGGERFVTAYGDHPSDAEGPGLDPAELREYQPGDPARHIDWAATARLTEAYVRTFEAETDRRLHLVLDTRASLGDGPAGETKLEYLRAVALAHLDRARRDRDPVGYAIVGADGILDSAPPRVGDAHYDAVRQALLDATPGSGASGRRDPGHARRRVASLGTADSAFARRLRPFLEAGAYTRESETPLRAAVEATEVTGTVWTIVLTDDTDPQGLREAVATAVQGDRRVRALLAPSALFAADGLTDLDAAYGAYRDFEELRQRLDSEQRVEAYEVGPGDRLDAILARATREATP